MTNWIEDWFGSEYYSLLYKHRDCDEAKIFIDNLISFLKTPISARILDCGCGRGRHSVYLSENGFAEVTGIDLSEKNILEAKKSETKNLTFYTHDIRNLFRINYYAVALSLFTSFGYFESDYENNKMLKSISAALKKNGMLVLDFMNAKREIEQMIAEKSFDCNGIHFKIKKSLKEKMIAKEIEVIDENKKYFFCEKVKAYSKNDLEKFLEANNLKVTSIFGDYNLNSFDEKKSERLILIAEKIT
jgi:SAM-dependent methyltransferase